MSIEILLLLELIEKSRNLEYNLLLPMIKTCSIILNKKRHALNERVECKDHTKINYTTFKIKLSEIFFY